MLWTTKSACLRRGEYVLGLRMSARSQVTLCAHEGGVEDAVIEDHVGSPDRLLSFCEQIVLP
jgi:hypothetical protein